MNAESSGPGFAVDAAALEADLATLGVDCSVEPRERLALVMPRAGHDRLADADVRREAVRFAEARGFSHLALELPEDGADEQEFR